MQQLDDELDKKKAKPKRVYKRKKKKDEEDLSMPPQPIPQDVLTGGMSPHYPYGPGGPSADPRFQSPYPGG